MCHSKIKFFFFKFRHKSHKEENIQNYRHKQVYKGNFLIQFIPNGTIRVNMDFLAFIDLGTKNRVRPKRDDSFYDVVWISTQFCCHSTQCTTNYYYYLDHRSWPIPNHRPYHHVVLFSLHISLFCSYFLTRVGIWSSGQCAWYCALLSEWTPE